MTKDEWVNIGYQNGIIELSEMEKITFSEAYRKWFHTKKLVNKGSTMDRIECTWNRYFLDTTLSKQPLSDITEQTLVDFFLVTITNAGQISRKEKDRIYQIVHGVLVFMRDRNTAGVRLYDWDMIKRNIPHEKVITEPKLPRRILLL